MSRFFTIFVVYLFFLFGTASCLTSCEEFYGDLDCPTEISYYEVDFMELMELMEHDMIGLCDVLSDVVTKDSISPHHFKINGVGDQDGL